MKRLLIPEDENLVSYFVLPLVGVSINTFGSRNYKISYINKEGTQVYVELKKPTISSTYTISPHYRNSFNAFGIPIIVFDVPEDHLEDLQLFIEGLYSKMSRMAKRKIYAGSTLVYNEKMEDFTVTHPILHCLASTKRMKIFLLTYLNVKELAVTGELIDPPDETWFIETRLLELKKENHGETKLF